MTRFGYTMMCEQAPPDQLVRDVQAAEAAGFDFSVISDHYQPWLEEQGHSGYAWSILGAAAQATSTIGLMTYVTCPTMRSHPAVGAPQPGHHHHGPNDLRDVPDDALPPRRGGAEGGHHADPVRQPLSPRARCRREPQKNTRAGPGRGAGGGCGRPAHLTPHVC